MKVNSLLVVKYHLWTGYLHLSVISYPLQRVPLPPAMTELPLVTLAFHLHWPLGLHPKFSLGLELT